VQQLYRVCRTSTPEKEGTKKSESNWQKLVQHNSLSIAFDLTLVSATKEQKIGKCDWKSPSQQPLTLRFSLSTLTLPWVIIFTKTKK
jgi:hypothetical protein